MSRKQKIIIEFDLDENGLYEDYVILKANELVKFLSSKDVSYSTMYVEGVPSKVKII